MNQFFPTSKQIQNLANKARNGTLVQILTGKDLLKPNLERKLLLNNQHSTINVDEIWAHLTTSQQKRLSDFADDINNIRNSSFIELIARINTSKTNTTLGTLGNNFFSGTNFQENNSVESLILPL
ncbi:22033_t:CDS:1, partial [Rhizophagus irregularis]